MELASLSEIIKEEGEWFTPAYPDGAKCDFSFFCIGRNTAEYRRVTHKNAVKYASNRAKEVGEVIGSADLFIACVKDWKGITDNGKEYPCTKENKKAMYENPRMRWLTEQVETWITDDTNFLSLKER